MNNTLHTDLFQRFQTIHQYLCTGLREREETMSVALLSVLAGQSVFLFGSPGTAKSLMARRLSCAFKESKHFEYLMQKFSTPEEIFGPIDIIQLKQGNYVRKTKGYLPTADFAFLDEIWKSNPAILNTLLTITNERIFRNGDSEDKTPLKALIGASNELPQSGLGLEALWDRFVVRLEVPPLQDKNNFEALLDNPSVEAKIDIPPELAFSTEEWQEWIDAIDKIKLSTQTKKFIHAVKVQAEEENKINNNFYISDRRWLRATKLLKSSAFFSGRLETNLQDALLLRHCLWNGVAQQAKIEEWLNLGITAACAQTTDWKAIDAVVDFADTLLKAPPKFNPAGESKEKHQYLQTIAGLLETKIAVFSHANAMKVVEKGAMGDTARALIPRNIKLLHNKLEYIHDLDVKQRLLKINRLLSLVS